MSEDIPLPVSAKFNQFVIEKFQEFEDEIKALKDKDCEDYSKGGPEGCGRDTISLFPYQKMVKKFLNDQTPYRGLLVYHMLGSGKTFTAVSVCENMDRKVIIICPSSLKESWYEHIIKFSCDRYGITWDEWLEAKKSKPAMKKVVKKLNVKYKFVSLNANNAGEKLRELQPIDDHLIVIDEVHNLSRNIVSDKSINGEIIYNILMDARNIKLLFLSATPIIKDPYELAVIFNILRGYMDVRVGHKTKRYTLFPKDYEVFYKLFVDRETLSIVNKNIFQERINGLVSYYKGIKDPNHLIFPKKYGPEIVRIPMSDYQWKIYAKFRKRELDEERRKLHAKKDFVNKPFKIPGKQDFSTFKVKTRQASNFVLPFKDKEGQRLDYPSKGIPSNKWMAILNKIAPKDLKQDELDNYSPKMLEVLEKLNKDSRQLSLVYSSFVVFGVEIMGRILKANGYYEYNGAMNPQDFIKQVNKDTEYKYFANMYGDVDELRRSNILSVYKHTDNKHGRFLRVLNVSGVIAEGINLRNLRKMHLLEPYWQDYLIQQIIGRAIRICSHYDLPPDQRDVTVYLYLATLPKGINVTKILGEKKNISTDEHVYVESLKRERLITSFLLAIKEVAVDCEVLKSHNFDERLTECIKCDNPESNKPVYYPNIDEHMMPGNSTCIKSKKKRPDYFKGPIIHDYKMYIVDPGENTLYQVCKIKFVGKIMLDRRPKEIEELEDKGIIDNPKEFKGVKKIDKAYILYHPKTLNAYAITAVKPVGFIDQDSKELIFQKPGCQPEESNIDKIKDFVKKELKEQKRGGKHTQLRSQRSERRRKRHKK